MILGGLYIYEFIALHEQCYRASWKAGLSELSSVTATVLLLFILASVGPDVTHIISSYDRNVLLSALNCFYFGVVSTTLIYKVSFFM